MAPPHPNTHIHKARPLPPHPPITRPMLLDSSSQLCGHPTAHPKTPPQSHPSTSIALRLSIDSKAASYTLASSQFPNPSRSPNIPGRRQGPRTYKL